MKSRTLHALAVSASFLVACKTGGGAPAGKAAASSVSLDPATKVAEVDGRPVTWGDLQADKEVGPKVKQAEAKMLTDLYEQRRGAVDELISALRLLETEAKAKGKTLEQWFQTDYMNTVPEPSDADAKAFYEEHKAQNPQGQSFEDLKPRIKQAVKQQKLRDNMNKMLEDLKSKHKVQVRAPAAGIAAGGGGGEGALARTGKRQGDHRRVQRLPVPVLRAQTPSSRS